MAFCPNCGAKVGDNDKFCGSCGATRVPGAPAGQPEPPPPQAQMPPPVYSQPTGGYQQPMGGAQMNAGAAGDSSTGMKANVAGLLCYLGVWVTGIIFLIIEKKSQFVKFHAAQSLVVFGALGILGLIFSRLWFLWFISAILGLLGFVLWVLLMYKAYHGETYKLPIAGDIASGIAGKM